MGILWPIAWRSGSENLAFELQQPDDVVNCEFTNQGIAVAVAAQQ